MVAVFEPTPDEPLLLACAALGTSDQRPRAAIAPGLLDAAALVEALRLTHLAALDEAYCRMGEAPDASDAPAPADWLAVPVAGLSGGEVRVDPAALTATVEAFARARLRLERLDCAMCARRNLESFLVPEGDRRSDAAARLDPLAAVSVDPSCESVAADLGALLAVPTGLALGRFGLVTDAAS